MGRGEELTEKDEGGGAVRRVEEDMGREKRRGRLDLLLYPF